MLVDFPTFVSDNIVASINLLLHGLDLVLISFLLSSKIISLRLIFRFQAPLFCFNLKDNFLVRFDSFVMLLCQPVANKLLNWRRAAACTHFVLPWLKSALARLANDCPDLEDLNLSRCVLIKSAGIEAFLDKASKAKLKHLDIRNCGAFDTEDYGGSIADRFKQKYPHIDIVAK